MKKHAKLILTGFTVVSIVTFVIFIISIITTNPTKLGPGGVTFWFINLLFLLSSSLTLAFYYLRTRKNAGLTAKKLRSSTRSGALIGLSLTVLLALSSLRSLSWRDIVLFLLLIILVEVYFRTRKETT
jgi:hypothetical protein